MKMKQKFEDYWKNYINRDLKYKFIKRLEKRGGLVEEFRKRWDIPTNGFETRSEVKNWQKEKENDKKHKYFSAFLTEKEFRYYTDGFELAGKFSSTREERRPRESKPLTGFGVKFHIEARKLIKELKLDPLWYHPFVKYILVGKTDMRRVISTGIQASERIIYDHKGEEIERNVCLTFGPNTRLKDIKLIWKPEVKKLQKNHPGYFQKQPRITPNIEKEYELGKYSKESYAKPKKAVLHSSK